MVDFEVKIEYSEMNLNLTLFLRNRKRMGTKVKCEDEPITRSLESHCRRKSKRLVEPPDVPQVKPHGSNKLRLVHRLVINYLYQRTQRRFLIK